MTPTPPILVIGGTGMVGRPVVRRMIEEGLPVRLLARTPAKAEARFGDRCEIREGDLRDRASLEAAMDGVGAIYVSLNNVMAAQRPAWDPDTDGTRLIVETALATGVKRVLRLSALGVDQAVDDWWVAAAKTKTDELMLRSGLDVTIFRPGWFMESLPTFLIGPTLLDFSPSPMKLYWLSGADYGSMVIEALRTPASIGRIYDVQGPDAASMSDALDRFRAAWGQWYPRVRVPRPLLRASAKAIGQSHYLDRLLDMTYVRLLGLPSVTDAQELFRPTMTIEDYVASIRATRDFPSKTPGGA